MKKLDDLFNIPGKIDSILVLYIVTLSMGRKDLGNTYELLGVIGEAPLPFPLGHVKDLMISFIGGKGEFVIFFDGMHRLSCLFTSYP